MYLINIIRKDDEMAIVQMIGILSLTAIAFSVYMVVRGFMTYQYSIYWIDTICKYHIICITDGVQPLVGYDDIMEFDEYLWRVYTFNKEKMIPNESKRRILLNFINDYKLH